MQLVEVDWPRLRGSVEHEIELRGISKRTASAEMGLSQNAMCRFLSGEIQLGATAFMNCCDWVGEDHPMTFCKLQSKERS